MSVIRHFTSMRSYQEGIGQDDGVTKVTEAIIRSKAGIKDPTKPIGSFMFLGHLQV